MKKYYDMVVVIPVGPGSDIDFTADTITSLFRYTKAPFRIVVMDDSHEGAGDLLAKRFPELDVHYTSRSLGTMCGLYINLAMTYKWILDRYHFTALLKLDTDALVIGSEPEKMALELFRKEPAIGIAGQYPFDYHGRPWDLSWPRDRVLNGVTTWKFIKRPRANWVLRKLYRSAVSNGYRPGESVFGGAYFMSEALLLKLQSNGLLPNYRLRGLNLGEDHLFALLAKSIGFGLGTLCAEGMPLACAWKGLPVSPERLCQDNKKIIHSTRNWNNMDEHTIREFFRERRNQHRHENAIPQNATFNG